MASDVEQALWALENAVEGVVGFVKAADYGLRLAAKRIGDLAAGGDRPVPAGGLDDLRDALAGAPQRLSEVGVLALGDHFRAFLARALGLAEPPPLPDTPDGVEQLAGTPGAARGDRFWFPLFLALYRAALGGGRLDRAAMAALGTDDLELRYPSGKVKLHWAGDAVVLEEVHFRQAGEAVLEVARSIHRHLRTA